MACTFSLCFTKMKSGVSKTRFFLLRGGFTFQRNMRCFCFYAVTNAAIDVRISCGIRVATGLAGCLIMENEIVSLWLTYWKIVWASQVQFEMKTAVFDIGCREASLFSENEPGPCMCVGLCAPQRWEEWTLISIKLLKSLSEWLLPLNTSVSFLWQHSLIPWNCHHWELVLGGALVLQNFLSVCGCVCSGSFLLISTSGWTAVPAGLSLCDPSACWCADLSFRTDIC